MDKTLVGYVVWDETNKRLVATTQRLYVRESAAKAQVTVQKKYSGFKHLNLVVKEVWVWS